MSETKILRVFIATLEGSILSYNVDLSSGTVTPSFTAKDHIGRIKAVHATQEGRLVTAGEDENMKVYNYLTRKAVSTVVGIVGIPVKIQSTKRFVISGQENGSVYILGKKDMYIFHVIKAFKTGLKDFAIHESGKLMLCLSRTNRFAVWNLMTCSMVFHKKIKAEIEAMDFYSDESLLFVTSNCMYLYSMSSMKFIQEIRMDDDTKINDMQVLRTWAGKWVVCGCENGFVYFFNERNFSDGVTEKSYVKFLAYGKRVKKVKCVDNLLVTISTDGDITVWDISEILEKQDTVEQLTLEGYCSLLDYKIQARPILLDINLRTVVEKVEKEEKSEEQIEVDEEAENIEEEEKKAEKIHKVQKVKGKKIKKESQK